MTRSVVALPLEEIDIPDKKSPLPPMPPDTWGISRAAAVDLWPHAGLRVQIPAWDIMHIGDSVVVRLDTNTVAQGSIIQADEVGKPVTLFIPSARLGDGGYFIVDYVVTRASDDPDFSPRTKIYAKLDLPGGKDENGSIPGHSELHMEIPADILLDGVDADTPFVPITIKSPVAGEPPYPNIAEGDRISLSWGGVYVEHEVTYDEAFNFEAFPIEVIVDKATIDEADDSDGLPVAFEIYDVVDNRSEDWSAEIRIVVDTGSSRLDAPIIKEAINNILDMDALPTPNTVTAQVIVRNGTPGNPDFAVGDQIEMRVKGTTLDGESIALEYPPKTIESVPSVPEIPLPSADIRPLVRTQAVFSYRLIKADSSADLLSKGQFVRVIGEAGLLAAPIAVDAIADTLDPALPRTVIEIPWDESMKAGQVIELKWFGTRAIGGGVYLPDLDRHPITQGEGDAKESIFMPVDGAHLRAIEGGTLELFYLLLRDTDARDVVSRESLHAELLNVGEPVAELPPPVVEHEQGGVLDPADAPTGTRLIVLKYTDQISGDEVHYIWRGSKTGSKTDSVTLNSITDKMDVPFDIPFALIKDNEGGTVRASYWVKRKAGGYSASEVLPMTIGAAMNLSAPSVKQATGTAPSQQLNPVAAKDALTVVIPEYGVQPGDQVRVTWTGTAGGGSHTTPAQALPTSREIPIPVEVLAYNLGKPVTVTYSVIRNGEASDPSAALNLAVQTFAPGDLLDARPKILQAENGGEGSELDLNTISANATCRAGVWPLIAPGQDVWLRLKGTKADGTSPYDLNIWTPPPQGPVASTTWINQGYYDTPVAYSYLKELKDGSTLTMEFKADFSQTTNEANAQTFPLRTYTIRAAMDLSAPRVKQATGTAPSQQLNPVAAKDALTVVIPEYGVQPGDQVSVTWTGTAGEGSHTSPAQALPTSREIDIPVEVLAYNLGKPVTVTYSVIRNGEASDPSAALNLAVQTFAPGDLQDARPKILQAENGGEGSELDLNTISANATCRAGVWPLIAPRQDVWLRLKGTKADGTSPYDLNIWTPPPQGPVASTTWINQGYYDVPAAYSYLKELKDGSTLTMEFKADFNKTTNEANAQTFPLRTYTIRAAMDLSAPRVKQATGTAPSQQLNPVAAKDALTVVIPEYGVQPGDQVRVTWTGTAGEGSHTSPAQALPTSREIDIPVEVLAYNLGKPVTVTYSVIRNGEASDPSAALNLAVQTFAPGDLQDARPKILQAENGGEGSELDLNTISANATCRAGVWPLIAPRQDVWLRLKGTKADGTTPYDLNIWTPPPQGPVASTTWINQGYYDTPVAYSYLKELKDGSTLTMEFKADLSQTTNEANAQTFPLRTYTIRAAMDLSAPRVKQATGTAPSQQLNPVAAKDALTVVIPEYGVQPGDQVSVTWTGTAGEGSHTTPAQALPSSREIPIPVGVLAYNLGKPVTVTYTVIRNGETSDPSTALNLAVQTFAPGDLLDARPKILQAENGGEGSELDLNTISANATCRAGVWPLIAPGQDVWLRLKGTKADGTSPYDLNIWTPPPQGPVASTTWINQGYYDTPVAYSYLKELKDGSTLTMEFKADLSQTTNEANAQTFPLRTYTVKTLEVIAPTLTDITDSLGSVVGGTTLETSVTVTGTGSRGQEIQLIDGADTIGGAVSIPADSTTWNTILTNLAAKAYSLKAKALYGDGQESEAKAFSVVAPLTINPEQMVLDTWIFLSSTGAVPPSPPPGAYEVRQPSGGVPPYRYSSSDPNVAYVDDTGKVTSFGNGYATITVVDQVGQPVSYTVAVSNVFVAFGTGVNGTYTQCSNAASNQGGRLPSLAEWQRLRSDYNGTPGVGPNWTWSTTAFGIGYVYGILTENGQTKALESVLGRDRADGFGIKAK